MKVSLKAMWRKRLKLHAKGGKLQAEGSKLWAEANRLWAEGDKLQAEGSKLWAEGDKLWAEAVLAVHGNIKLEWKNWNEERGHECWLENGEVFK